MIRTIYNEDIDKIIKLLKREVKSFDESKLKEELKDSNNNSLIYEKDGGIQGFSIAIIRDKELKKGEIIIYVLMESRNNGIGSSLNSAARDYLKGLNISYIRTDIRVEKSYTEEFFINRGANKWFGYRDMEYSGGKLISDMQPVNYEDIYYEKYKKVYEDCFFKMRKELGIEPYRICASREKLKENKDKIFLLIDGEEVICSVLLSDNEIDDVIVNEKYQRQGYCKRLIKFAINHFQDLGVKNISLGVAEWNVNAIKIYESCGFNTITKYEVYRYID